MKTLFLSMVLCGAASAASAAGVQFSCGRYDVSVAASPGASLATTATAMFSSPGTPMPVSFLVDTGPWWLIDSYGTGPLMGCLPSVSDMGGSAGTWSNSYRDGKLTSQSAPASDGPVVLNYTYDGNNRVLTSESVCYSGAISQQKLRTTWRYKGDKLVSAHVEGPDACPSGPYPIDIEYAYGSRAAPGLPSGVKIRQAGKTTEARFSYIAKGGVITEVLSTSPGGAFTIQYQHKGKSVSQYTMGDAHNKTVLQQAYRGNGQWQSSLQRPPGWGLSMTYDSANRVLTAGNNTGCPDSCLPVKFVYEGEAK